MKRACLLILAMLMWPLSAPGKTWQVDQGDLLRLNLSLPAGWVQITAFGQTWPWRRLDDGHVRAWIGIDMQARPGDHPLQLLVENGQRRWRRRDILRVRKVEVPRSRITVARRLAEFDAATLARIRREQANLQRVYVAKVEAEPDFHAAFLPVPGPISSPFGAQRIVNGEPRAPHAGIDIAAPLGTPVRAPLAGRVLLAAEMYLNGKTIVLGHGGGLVSVFSHLREMTVQPGQWVEKGMRIGRVGATGRATGPHLHWGVRFKGARIHPLSLLAELD